MTTDQPTGQDGAGGPGIEWREWSQDAFEEAARERKPVLLSISAVWCHWCHVMDDTTYSEPEVARRIRRDYVPVRVDTDRRPDVNSRYNMGGWPTTAFLTPEGEILTGATYLPAEDMIRVLDRVTKYYREHADEITTQLRESALTPGDDDARPIRTAGGGAEGTARGAEVTPLDPEQAREAVNEVLGHLEEAFDPTHGGFGTAPKFPHPSALELLLTSHLRTGSDRHLTMLDRTLRAMREGGMYDQVAGGFFRYSTTRDWAVPHFEKMLQDNAQLLTVYARMARLTGDDFYTESTRDVVRFLGEWLRSENGFFFGSQDADEEYYQLSGADRAGREAPFVDRTLYAGWNALVVRGLLEAYLATREVRLREMGLVALEYCLGALGRDDGLFHHYLDEAGERGPVLMEDAAELVLSLTDAYELTGEARYLELATASASAMVRRFGDPAAPGLFDTAEEGEKLGRLRIRQKSLAENARAALALLRLAAVTRDSERRRQAEAILGRFLGLYGRHGLLAAEYALALDWQAGPVAEVTIGGSLDDEATRSLVFACGAAVTAAKAVRFESPPSHDGATVAAGSVAHVCCGQTCLEPVRDPARLEAVIRRAAERREGPTGEGPGAIGVSPLREV